MREGKGEIGLNIQVVSLAAATCIVFILRMTSGGLAKSGQKSWESKVNSREGRKKGIGTGKEVCF